MTSRKPGERPAGPYSIQVDETLFQDAVAAVEARMRHESGEPVDVDDAEAAPATPPRRERKESARLADQPQPVPFDVELSLSVEPSEPTPAPIAAVDVPDPPSTPSGDPSVEPGLDLATLAAEWQRLQAELEKVRAQRDRAAHRAEFEARERVRLATRLRRLQEQVASTEELNKRAEAAERKAESQVSLAREAVRQAQETATRVRERARREEEEHRNFGHGRVVLQLLPVLENLERAVHFSDANPDRVVEGVRITLEQFVLALSRLGVKRVEAARGSNFRPAVHEAVAQVEAPGVAPGAIVNELQAGYVLNGRLLRAARVSVAALPAAPPPEETAADASADAPPDEPVVFHVPDDIRALDARAERAMAAGHAEKQREPGAPHDGSDDESSVQP